MTAVDAIALRLCDGEDAEALALIGAATFLEAFAGVLPGKAMLQHCARHHVPRVYTNYLSDPRVRCWLAETRHGGAPVGYAMLTPADLPLEDPGPGDIELRRIYLFSKFQGTGVGQEMMDTAISESQALGYTRLLLGVYGGNARAIRFYERNGFRRIGVRSFTVGDLVCDDLVLARLL